MSASTTSAAVPAPVDSRPNFSPAEWQTRVELAACFRLLARFRMTDLTATHATARIADTDDHILINPYGLLFEEITASCLVKMDLEGNILSNTEHPPVSPLSPSMAPCTAPARTRHAPCTPYPGRHRGRGARLRPAAGEPDVARLLQPCRLQRLRVSHGSRGVRPARARPRRKERNDHAKPRTAHCGGSVGEAFMRMYYLDKACEIQLDAMATGRELELPPPEVCEEAGAALDGHRRPPFRRGGVDRPHPPARARESVLPYVILQFRLRFGR